jgi:hypothetical protein
MDTPGSDDLAAMLKHEGIDYASLPRVPHNGDPRDLVSGKADAMVAYSTNEPFVLAHGQNIELKLPFSNLASKGHSALATWPLPRFGRRYLRQ